MNLFEQVLLWLHHLAMLVELIRLCVAAVRGAAPVGESDTLREIAAPTATPQPPAEVRVTVIVVHVGDTPPECTCKG